MSIHRAHADPAASHSSRMTPTLEGWLAAFRDCFTAPVWAHVLVLVAGAILAPGKRTVSQALRVMGLASNPGFGRYHEVLSRARWDSRTVARTLLKQVLDAFLPTGEVVIGVDDTIERRWGPKIKARGIGTAARLGVVTLSGLIRSEARLVLAGVRHETVPAYATYHAARRRTMLRPPILRQSRLASRQDWLIRERRKTWFAGHQDAKPSSDCSRTPAPLLIRWLCLLKFRCAGRSGTKVWRVGSEGSSTRKCHTTFLHKTGNHCNNWKG